MAIAVDNLANAQEMTAQQEEAERIAKEIKEKNFKNEVNMFSSPPDGSDPANPICINNEIKPIIKKYRNLMATFFCIKI